VDGTLFTVGHSTRALDDFLALLAEQGVRLLVDVRRFPSSRRHPHFSGPALAAALQAKGIAYRHEPDLGGRRAPRPDSVNLGWRNEGFRGYADHMADPAFGAALARLRAEPGPVAVMCAEAVPWRCHRQLIADALVARGIDVRHILGPGRAEEHRLTPGARIEPGGGVAYPGRTGPQSRLFEGG
jgi:uncharacterized protein (DUF488 family)